MFLVLFFILLLISIFINVLFFNISLLLVSVLIFLWLVRSGFVSVLIFILVITVYAGAIMVLMGYICAICPNFSTNPTFRST